MRERSPFSLTRPLLFINFNIFVLISIFIFNFFSFSEAAAKMITQTVEYKDGETVLEGYLAYDPARLKKGRAPGVLVVHEWMGINPYTQKRVEQLANDGFVAFAPDIYGKGIRPQDPKEAGQLAGKYKADRALMRRRILAGLHYLQELKQTETKQIAAIGYCFGGTTVLELARSGADVKGVVSFHGGLDTPNPEDAKNIKGRVLALHGADDPHVPSQQVLAFQEEMRKANVDWQLIAYGGAVHSFTNPNAGSDPSKGSAYHEKADKRSWKAMKVFFDELFQKES